MKSKTFDYRRVPDHTIPRKRWIKRPMLQVTLFSTTKRKQHICLVDSGADESLFHSSIGRNLEIDIESGRFKRFDGIAGSLEAYMHSIEIQIQDFPERVKIEVGFTDSEGVDAILGQAGFFENYRVCFDRSRGKIEIATRADSAKRWQE